MIAGPREHERAEKLEGRASTCAMLMCKERTRNRTDLQHAGLTALSLLLLSGVM